MKQFKGGILSIPFIILVWMVISSRYTALIFPGPLVVFKEMQKQLISFEFYHHIGVSLYRLAIGFAIAAASAFLIGTLAGVSEPFRKFLSPMVMFFQATPPMAWAPLLILMLDLGNAPMIAVIVLAAFFPILVKMIGGNEGIGWLIASTGQIGNSSLVMVGIITIGVLAMFFEFILLKPLKKRFVSWASHS
ncbi:ABC transporter permease [Aneurinibacillus tyrosinisolvens]|uniref:ABC transporter permease n=1 Tax=Aneurinibacillus tyrosinisolvens TaxID=1443435 RepID=UPI00063FA5A9|nr:hypothetical protein [Aneurinibacillus tyrosinisolvens]